MVARFVWEAPPSVLSKNLAARGKRLLEAILALGRFFAAKMESYARANARWTDRTANARQGLTGRALKTAAGVTIILFHTMSYGIWLEVAMDGKYAIILDTLEAHYGELSAALRSLVGGA